MKPLGKRQVPIAICDCTAIAKLGWSGMFMVFPWIKSYSSRHIVSMITRGITLDIPLVCTDVISSSFFSISNSCWHWNRLSIVSSGHGQPGHCVFPVACPCICPIGNHPCIILLVWCCWVVVQLECTVLITFQHTASKVTWSHPYLCQQYSTRACPHFPLQMYLRCCDVTHIVSIFKSAFEPVYGSRRTCVWDHVLPSCGRAPIVSVTILSHSMFRRADRGRGFRLFLFWFRN